MTDHDPHGEANQRPAQHSHKWHEALTGGRAAIVTFVVGTVIMLVLSAALLLALLLRHPAGPGIR